MSFIAYEYERKYKKFWINISYSSCYTRYQGVRFNLVQDYHEFNIENKESKGSWLMLRNRTAKI
jgi:hypothetical protein